MKWPPFFSLKADLFSKSKYFGAHVERLISSVNADKRNHRFLIYTVIGFTALFFFYLANFRLSLFNQFIVGWSGVLLLIIFKRDERFRRVPFRIVFVLLSVFITLRYWLWRSSETIVYTSLTDFMALSALYLAELYALVIHFLGIFANIWPLETKIMPLPDDTALYPIIDVFIPTYNEDMEIVRVTATAASQIDYPRDKMRVYILDDGATVAKRNNPGSSLAAWERHYALRRMAAELGVQYITREKNTRAKAGNLNHALTHTSGDLVLILDCDHVPTKDILKNTVGWFLKDEKLAFIQTPHFFINPSPLEKNLDLAKDAPGENEMFYRANHPGMDFWNSSFFCGSAAILRRKYLMEVGGVAGETITEDCETAFSLHKLGYRSVYISRPMVCGMSPETFEDFIVQRSRWAQGMTQILVLNNPLFAKGLTLQQRLCYFNNCFFWFFGFARVIFYLAPTAFILFNLKIYFASVPQVLAYALPHVIGGMVLMDHFYGKYRMPFFSELYESVQSLFLLPAVASVLLNPRKPSFKVTPKGKNLDNEFLSNLALPFLLMCIVLLAAIPLGVMRWVQYPLYRDVILITLMWGMFNFLLGMASFGAFLEKRQVRRYHRLWAKGKVLVFIPRLRQKVEADIHDISMSGIRISFRLPFQIMPLEHVVLERRDSSGEKYSLEARMHRTVQDGELSTCGCEFILNDEKQFAAGVGFVYGDSQRWVDYWQRRSKPVGVFKVFLFIVKMTLKGVRASAIASYDLTRTVAKSAVAFFGRVFTAIVSFAGGKVSLRDAVIALISRVRNLLPEVVTRIVRGLKKIGSLSRKNRLKKIQLRPENT